MLNGHYIHELKDVEHSHVVLVLVAKLIRVKFKRLIGQARNRANSSPELDSVNPRILAASTSLSEEYGLFVSGCPARQEEVAVFSAEKSIN